MSFSTACRKIRFFVQCIYVHIMVLPNRITYAKDLEKLVRGLHFPEEAEGKQTERLIHAEVTN